MVKNEKRVQITLIKSKFGRTPGHRECVEGLGLKNINQTIEVDATDCNLGMINKVKYLLDIKAISEDK